MVTAAVPSVSAADDYDLAALKAATEKYRDVNAALAAGYIPIRRGTASAPRPRACRPNWAEWESDDPNPALLKITASSPRVDGGSTHTDFLNPSILL